MRPSPSVGIGLWVEFWGQRRERAAHPTQAPIHVTRMSPGNSCVYIKFISVVYVPLIGFLMCVCVQRHLSGSKYHTLTPVPIALQIFHMSSATYMNAYELAIRQCYAALRSSRAEREQHKGILLILNEY